MFPAILHLHEVEESQQEDRDDAHELDPELACEDVLVSQLQVEEVPGG